MIDQADYVAEVAFCFPQREGRYHLEHAHTGGVPPGCGSPTSNLTTATGGHVRSIELQPLVVGEPAMRIGSAAHTG